MEKSCSGQIPDYFIFLAINEVGSFRALCMMRISTRAITYPVHLTWLHDVVQVVCRSLGVSPIQA
jgi:hypothetical protein